MTKKKTRLAGAQLPIGIDIQWNKKEILNAIDWALENEVDHQDLLKILTRRTLPGWPRSSPAPGIPISVDHYFCQLLRGGRTING